jgi:hypothetical protein
MRVDTDPSGGSPAGAVICETQRMNKPSDAIIAILLVVFIVVGATYSLCLAEEHLKYPGNGFPHFSKNKPIIELNAEIQRQVKSNRKITFSQGRMIFNDVSGFKFTSSKSLIGQRFCLSIPLSIDKGSCTIKIGDVMYFVDQDVFRVTEKGKVVFESKKEKPVDIIAEVFSRSNSSTRFHSKRRLMEIVNVSFSEPAVISITLDGNCSGWIGPWEWLRGYE